ncbi:MULTISPECIES: peptide chain release factor 2 [Afifella]|uniref:peptide chain release factor 2 n=1 Tax=Afifella TaxID=643217 RepID=UPI000FE3F767|nr:MULTISPECIES: peptide chain release factor 2 [Afifella]MCT8266072.1 peptide chain release factor 2 [Afifella sp. JA880]
MRAEIENLVDEIREALTLIRRHLDWDVSQKRLAKLNERVEDPTLWDDPQEAQKVMRERQRLETAISGVREIEASIADSIELIELAEEEDDDTVIAEAEKSLVALHKDVQRRQVEALLSGEADASDAYLEVHAGAGGTESQDWASMLLRMYTRWGERRKFSVELISQTDGEEAGIKSATLLLKGENAYGWLKTESGVHRLVRISPFDSQARRHTSFSSVWVYPVVDDNIEIEIQDKDIRIDTYRSSGAGGQHVNTTDSAVRITHLPTGIVVTSSEKSQHQNRANAMKALKSRLYEMELKKREESIQEAHEAKSEIGWGHQIRSYVLQPYQLVKDLRTSVEHTTPSEVLDGDLDGFMEAALAQRVGSTDNTEEAAE